MTNLDSVAGRPLRLRYPATIVPPLTPFTDDLKVDYDALARMVDYVVEDCDASMVVAAGVEAQEYQYLDLSERKELLARTIEFVGGRRPVVAGISHPSTRVALQLAEFAQEKGADAVQLLAPLRPTGGAPSTGELVDYFEVVLQGTSLPMMVYVNAGPGADVPPGATIELAKLDGVAFIKESSRDQVRVSRLLAEIEHAGHARYFTTMQMWLSTLAQGGSGVTVPPPAALITRQIATAFEAGNFAEAARLQAQLAVFPARWMEVGLTAVMKAALEHLGIRAGLPYPPYRPVTGTSLDKLKAHIDALGLVSAALSPA